MRRSSNPWSDSQSPFHPPLGDSQLPRSVLIRYGLAALSVVAAWAFRTALDPILGNLQPFAAFYLPVAVIAWVFGPGPAVLAALSGWLVADWCFVPPRHVLLGGGLADVIASTVFLIISAVLIL